MVCGMKKWDIKDIAFDPTVEKALRVFLRGNPTYKKMLDARINDLLNFPELVWASALIDDEDSNEAEFVTHNQQIDLAGKVYRKSGLVYITYFAFHR